MTAPSTTTSTKNQNSAAMVPVEAHDLLQQGLHFSMQSYVRMVEESNKLAAEAIKHSNFSPKVIGECEKFQKEMLEAQKKAVESLWKELMGINQVMQQQLSRGVEEVNDLNLQSALLLKKIEQSGAQNGILDLSKLVRISNNSLDKIISQASNLTQVDLRGTKVSIEGIQLILDKSPKLVSLQVDQVEQYTGKRSIDFKNCPDITEDSILSVLKCCPVLSSITLSKCANVTDKTIQFISEHPPLVNSLQGLNVYGCYKATANGFNKIGNLKNLINLSTPKSINISGLISILKSCGSWLKELTPDSHPEFGKATQFVSSEFENSNDRLAISDASIKRLFGLFPYLTALTFRYSNLSDQACAVLPQKLTWLAIQGSLNLTNRSLDLITKRCPDLNLLAVDGAPITDEGLQFVGSLKKLTKLHLSRTKISYKGLRSVLPSWPYITEINIIGTSITKDNVEEVRKAFPKVKFNH